MPVTPRTPTIISEDTPFSEYSENGLRGYLNQHENDITDLQAQMNDQGQLDLTGDVVGTDDAQTLTNKTIDASSNTISNLLATMFGTGQFLRLSSSAQNYKIQFGSYTTGTRAASSSGDVSIPLTTAWPTAHSAFFASVAPTTTWTGITLIQVTGPNGLSNGNVRIHNGSTAQTFTVNWMSIGY